MDAAASFEAALDAARRLIERWSAEYVVVDEGEPPVWETSQEAPATPHETPDWWAVTLQVAPDANAREVKRAYRKRAIETHPDSTGDPATADLFKVVNEAYQYYRQHVA